MQCTLELSVRHDVSKQEKHIRVERLRTFSSQSSRIVMLHRQRRRFRKSLAGVNQVGCRHFYANFVCTSSNFPRDINHSVLCNITFKYLGNWRFHEQQNHSISATLHDRRLLRIAQDVSSDSEKLSLDRREGKTQMKFTCRMTFDLLFSLRNWMFI